MQVGQGGGACRMKEKGKRLVLYVDIPTVRVTIYRGVRGEELSIRTRGPRPGTTMPPFFVPPENPTVEKGG